VQKKKYVYVCFNFLGEIPFPCLLPCPAGTPGKMISQPGLKTFGEKKKKKRERKNFYIRKTTGLIYNQEGGGIGGVY